MRILSLLIVFPIFVGCGTIGFGPKADKEAFYRELIFPEETTLSKEFDAYSSHSYFVNKKELATELPEAAEEHGEELIGLYLIGPGYMDPLWTYYIMAFFKDGETAKENILIYPHGRITGKGTTKIYLSEYENFKNEFRNLEFLSEGWPEEEENEGNEYAYDILAVDYSNNSTKVLRGSISELEEAQAEQLSQVFNSLFERARITYPKPKMDNVQPVAGGDAAR